MEPWKNTVDSHPLVTPLLPASNPLCFWLQKHVTVTRHTPGHSWYPGIPAVLLRRTLQATECFGKQYQQYPHCPLYPATATHSIGLQSKHKLSSCSKCPPSSSILVSTSPSSSLVKSLSKALIPSWLQWRAELWSGFSQLLHPIHLSSYRAI